MRKHYLLGMLLLSFLLIAAKCTEQDGQEVSQLDKAGNDPVQDSIMAFNRTLPCADMPTPFDRDTCDAGVLIRRMEARIASGNLSGGELELAEKDLQQQKDRLHNIIGMTKQTYNDFMEKAKQYQHENN